MMNSKKLKMIFGGTILASAIVLNSVNAVVTSSTFLKGDVNRDTKITLDDCELIKEHIMEEVTLDEEQLYLADVDGENGITAADYVKLKNYIEGRSYRFLIGDVSRDGKITQDDADVLYDHISETNLLDGEQSYLADIFEDGKANGKDYIRVLEILNGTYKRYEMGDVNRDGKLTDEDAQLILQYYTGKVEFDDEQKILGNMDDDEEINAKDAKIVAQYVSGVKHRFPIGDVNRDGRITEEDIDIMYNHINETNILEGEQFALGDLNSDGKVNAKDCNMLFSVINGSYKRFLMGDVNRDGRITSDDRQLILDSVQGNIILDDEQKWLADMNENEVVDLTDYSILQKIITGINKRFELGDIDRDGAVTSKDCELIVEYARDNSVLDEEQIWLGDINGDEKVNAGDYVALLNRIREEANSYIKGDLDRNGVVDANDASIALELYKAQNALMEDIIIGDLDNNNLIDANDASLILEVYKTNN